MYSIIVSRPLQKCQNFTWSFWIAKREPDNWKSSFMRRKENIWAFIFLHEIVSDLGELSVRFKWISSRQDDQTSLGMPGRSAKEASR